MQFTEEWSQGEGIRQAEAKTKKKVNNACDKKWWPPYGPATLERIKWEREMGQIRGLHLCQEEMNIPTFGKNCKVETLTQRKVGWNILVVQILLTLRTIGLN